MQRARKLVLISKEELEKLRKCTCHNNGGMDGKKDGMQTEIENEMNNVLETKTLSDREKWLKYSQLFNTYQKKLKEKTEPLKIEIRDSSMNVEDVHPGKDSLIEELPLDLREKIRFMLKHLKKSDVSWNDLGEVYIRNNRLEGSNIKELLLDVVLGKNNYNVDPVDRKKFISTLDVQPKTSKRIIKKDALDFISQFAASPEVRRSKRKSQHKIKRLTAVHNADKRWEKKTMRKKDVKKLLSKYYDLRSPVAFSGARRLIEKGRDKGILRNTIAEWLSSQEAYTRHKPVIRKFKRRYYYASRDKELWQCDLCDMRSLSRENDGYNYLLTCIDIFSKFAYIRPLTDKKPRSVISALRDIFETAKPEKLNTDKGSEFTAKSVQNFLHENDVNFYTTQDPTVKAAIIERFNRSLKERMWRYFTHKQTHRYIDHLNDFVASYNNAYHKSIRMKPEQVNENNLYEVWTNLYGDKKLGDKTKPLYSTGDYVLVAKEKGTFSKGYEPGWREEIFRIKRVQRGNPVTYTIEDLLGEEITGSFYTQEIQKIKHNAETLYKIDKIVAYRGKGKQREGLVQWSGYPSKYFPDNTTASYTTQLDKRIELEGEWEVGVVEVQYPNTVQNVSEGHNYFKILHKKPLDGFDGKVVIDAKHYDSIATLVSDINRHEVLVRFGLKMEYIHSSDRVRIARLGDEILHVTPSPKLTVQLGFFPDTKLRFNSLSDFPANINSSLPSQMYIYSDIVENNLVGDTSVQLLRTLPMKVNKHVFGTNEWISFDTPHYLPVMRRSFDNIQIHLSEETGMSMPFLYGTACVKLHFRRAPRYYVRQAGSGVSNVYRGVEWQRGHGIGSFLGGLFRKVIPFLTRGAKVIGKETAKAGLNVLDDISRDVPIKEALKTRFGDVRDNLKRKAEAKIDDIMSGSGYKVKKRKRRAQSGVGKRRVKKSPKRRKPKTSKVKKRRSKRTAKNKLTRAVTRDIFS
ncbi:UNVERIFIED_CONTAM: hypothetical protein B566_EDAN018374 [Ephemera danica]|nr:hypothetical protein B566_EDAN018374 [Ephemera danica]